MNKMLVWLIVFVLIGSVATATTLTTGLVSCLDADTDLNSSTQTYNGTWSGVARHNTTIFKTGTGAITLDGNNYVNWDNVPLGTEYTVNIWVYDTSLLGSDGTNSPLFGRKVTGNVYAHPFLFIQTNAGSNLQIGDGTARDISAVGDWAYPVNSWTMITIAHKDNIYTMYRNGTYFFSTTSTKGVDDTTEDFIIGYMTGDYWGYRKGIVDTPAIWSRNLTPAELTELYNGGAGGMCPQAPIAPNIAKVNFTSDGGTVCTWNAGCANTSDTSPTFILTTSYATGCRASTTNESYEAMSDNVNGTTSDNLTYSLTFSTQSDGEFLPFFACNGSGGNVSTRANITIDTTAPLSYLNYPANNTIIANVTNITFRWNATDARSQVSCTLGVDDVQKNTNVTINNTATYQFANITSGVHNWSITCGDYLGNIVAEKYNYFNVTRNFTIGFGTNISSVRFRMNLSNATFVIVKNGSNISTGITNVTTYNNSAVNQTYTNPLFNISASTIYPSNVPVYINISNTAGGPGRIRCSNTSNIGISTLLSGTAFPIMTLQGSTSPGIWCWMDWLNATEQYNFTITVRQ